ncbi:hypothetical protein SAMN04488540_11048 [Ferrimonas sediminum]|uniref:DUF2157 domain-containing protein n=1 Tax=Ferrimonas sediminum TaxID=718193 RepID=A0A1G8UZQ0_9GAMM|nr:hypothetical protein [Ferrimonas sediminum]SDJ59199.1 hypothetical protein SAMN04488540_11048 [Ferrimonas sediminum]
MSWDNREADALNRALQQWQQQGLLDADTVRRLTATIEVRRFDWRRLARYSFLVALVSLGVSVASVLLDPRVIDWIASVFQAPVLVRSVGLALLALALLIQGQRLRQRDRRRRYQVEALFLGAVCAIGGALVYLADYLSVDESVWRWWLLSAVTVYALLGLWLRSSLIWAVALLTLALWLLVHSVQQVGWEALWYGMNPPARLALLGAVLALSATAMSRPAWRPLWSPTWHIGLSLMFINLWLLTLFGNHHDPQLWSAQPQWQLWPWALLAALVSVAAMLWGLRCDEAGLRLYGLAFLILNLYSRFFEQFWDSLHKGVLFAIAGASFWLLGRQAERIWNRSHSPDDSRRSR